MISESILNLKEERLITAPEDDPHVASELRNQGAPLHRSSEEDDDLPPDTPPESKSSSCRIHMLLGFKNLCQCI